jgi:hypothetical protein
MIAIENNCNPDNRSLKIKNANSAAISVLVEATGETTPTLPIAIARQKKYIGTYPTIERSSASKIYFNEKVA